MRRPDDKPSRAQGPVTEAERVRVAELHGQGWSRAAIARELGRAPDTVGRIATAAGLSWDRSATAAAVAAKQIDNKDRRTRLVEGGYEQALAVIARLANPDGYDATGMATNGKVVVTHVELPPSQEVKALASAYATFTAAAARMEALDSSNGAEQAKSMLGGLADALNMAAEHIQAPEE